MNLELAIREQAAHKKSSADFSEKSPFKQLLGSLFGFDFFISYAWADARDYAVELAERLERKVDGKKFSCFLDSEDYSKGSDWKEAGREALERTSILILVGSPKSLKSDPVLREVRVFTERKNRVIPIEFVDGEGNGTFDANRNPSALHQYIRPEILRIKEPLKYRDDASNQLAGPSEVVVTQITGSFDLITQEDKRARVFGVAALVFAIIAVLAIVFWRQAVKQESIAKEQRDVAQREARIAEAGRLAAESSRLSHKPQVSSLLASEAVLATVRAGDPPDLRAEQALRDSLNRLGGQGLGRFDSEIEAVGFLRGGNHLFALLANGGLYMWHTPESNAWSAPSWTTTGTGKIERLGTGENSISGLSQGYLLHWTADGEVSPHRLPQMPGYEEDDVSGLDLDLNEKRAWRSSATLGRLEGFNLQGPFDQPAIRLTIDDSGFNRSIFSPRANWLFVESFDGEIYLTELLADDPAQTVLRLTSSSNSPVAVAGFDSSGQALAVGHEDGTIEMWRLSERQPIPSLSAKVNGSPQVLCFADDMPWLVVVQDDPENKEKQSIVLLDISMSPAFTHELPSVPFDAADLQFSPDARWLAVSDGLRATALIDFRAGLDRTSIHVLHRHPNPEDIGGVVPAPVKFSPDSRWLATVTDDNQAHLWCLQSEIPSANHLILAGHDDPVFTLAFDDAGRWLITGSYDQTLRSWDLQQLNTSTWPFNLRETSRDRILRKSFSSTFNPEGGVELVRFNSLGDRVMVWGEFDKRELWRIHESGLIELERHFEDRFPFMSNTGRWLLMLQNGVDDVLIDLESETGLEQRPLTIESSGWYFSEGDEYLICGDESGRAQVWKLTDGPRLIQDMQVANNKITGVHITPDGRYSVLVTESHAYWQQRDTSGAVVASEKINLGDSDDAFGVVEVSDDGQTLLIDFDRTFERSNGGWKTTDLPEGPGHSVKLGRGLILRTTDEFTEIQEFTADGKWRRHDATATVGYAFAEKYDKESRSLGVSVKGGDVLIFRKAGLDFKPQVRLPTRGKNVTAIAISPTDFATGERDGTVRLWRRQTKTGAYEAFTLGHHRGGVNYLDFSPDGRWLASGGEDNEALVYPIGIDRLMKSAQTAVGRGFTDAEFESAFPRLDKQQFDAQIHVTPATDYYNSGRQP